MIAARLIVLMIGLTLLAGLVWSGWRVVTGGWPLRLAHAAAGTALIAALWFAIAGPLALAQAAGWVLVAAGIAAFAVEDRAGRLIPLIHIAAGLVAGLGLPAAGG